MITKEVTSKPFPLFKDVFGLQEIIDELTHIVEFVNENNENEKHHLVLPKGILLYGEPGTGKTFLVQALVNELNLNYIHLSAQDSPEHATNNLESIFTEARSNGPSVIFIDELDSFIESNEYGMPDSKIINKLLNLMDGFEKYKGVIVIAATTRFDVIPEFLLRAGRFDRKYHVPLPDLQALEISVEHILKTLEIETNENAKSIATMFVGMSIAEVKTVLNEVYMSKRLNKNTLTMEQVIDGIEKYKIGLCNINQVYNQDVKKRIAIHEIAHAFFHQKFKGIENMVRISLVKRENNYGHVMATEGVEHMSVSKSAIEHEVMILLAGHAAEVVFFKEATSGGAQDIDNATYMVTEMVTRFAMSKLTPRNYGLGNNCYPMDIGEKTRNALDGEVNRIITRFYKKAKKIVRKNRKIIHHLAQILEEKTMLSNEEFKELLEKNKQYYEAPF